MHADPRFARLEESFHPATPLRVPVHYTGFVAPGGDRRRRADRAAGAARGRLGRRRGVGAALMRAAVEAHRLELADAGVDARLVAGPFLPEPSWQLLRAAARAAPGSRSAAPSPT